MCALPICGGQGRRAAHCHVWIRALLGAAARGLFRGKERVGESRRPGQISGLWRLVCCSPPPREVERERSEGLRGRRTSAGGCSRASCSRSCLSYNGRKNRGSMWPHAKRGTRGATKRASGSATRGWAMRGAAQEAYRTPRGGACAEKRRSGAPRGPTGEETSLTSSCRLLQHQWPFGCLCSRLGYLRRSLQPRRRRWVR